MGVLDKAQVEKFFRYYLNSVQAIRNQIMRPMTLAEKIIFSHLISPGVELIVRGKTLLELKPDRVVMQDATAQMAILQFMSSRRSSVAVPSSVHCDHLIRAEEGAKKDLLRALDENKEVYDFLESASLRYGIDFWGPGAGIIHQVVLEKYALPGNLIIGTDSHTPNAGGLGSLAIGVGGADAAEVMAGLNWTVTAPKLVGVYLTGSLNPWCSGKDVIMRMASILTVKGGTGKIIEYFGPGVSSLSLTGRATITNMGAELGATTSIFPVDFKTLAYLSATEREFVVDIIQNNLDFFQPDKAIYDDPHQYFDELYEINLSELEPGWVGPHTPDLFNSVFTIKDFLEKNQIPSQIRYALIGSCTNSSYEDLTRAASIAKQAKDKGIRVRIPLLITPGSDQIFQTIQRDGLMDIFYGVGAEVLANACGPCIGQWSRNDIKPGERNVIVTSYNRNFKKRNDGNEETMAFISSPEMVTAIAFYGALDANPLVDPVIYDGSSLKFEPPKGRELPDDGFVISYSGFKRSRPEERNGIVVLISENSERLSFLPTFPSPKPSEFKNLRVLFKAVGKCTTDHISPAGSWLKYRGHLDKISDNLLLAGVNAFTAEPGTAKNVLTGEVSTPASVARFYKQNGIGWIIVGDENYGEGSSREHAAMTPRYLNCKAVIAKSFARIHETNLKKQGVLALTFVNPADYDIFTESSIVSFEFDENWFEEGSLVMCRILNINQEREIELSHSYTKEQIEWFKKGSALNMFSDS
ncbi:MAG: aconitate hydratase [Deltaproteobacteria bacterium]|nr:aconitate hydratase [Deltaproteobacteria bacterium]